MGTAHGTEELGLPGRRLGPLHRVLHRIWPYLENPILGRPLAEFELLLCPRVAYYEIQYIGPGGSRGNPYVLYCTPLWR
jgi:hypothetical protein